MVKKEEIVFLNQLVKSLEEGELKLEEAHEKKNHEDFNKMKKFMMEIQKQISEVVG